MIRVLPPEVRSCLRSGVATPSIAQCVEELVLNGVDAAATCIAVRVDIPNCRIQVVDNGRGLAREAFELVGCRYATSKCSRLADLENLTSFGYRGEALASIGHISRVLEIVSRAEGADVTLSKLFNSGKAEVFEVSRKRPSVGTTVTAHGVFHNLPVRRRMVSEGLDYEKVCQRMEGLALIHPHVSFSLRNDSTGARSVQTCKTSSVLNTFRFLFGEPKARGLKEVAHRLGNFTVRGYIGVEGHPNKALQFLYVNSRLILRTRLHKAVNHLLRKSFLAHSKAASDSADRPPAEVTGSPCRGADRYGVFVLNVKCPHSEYDVCLEPSKSLVEFKDWPGVLECVEQLVKQFLTRENLTMRVDGHEDQSSPNDQCGTELGDDSSQDQDTDSDTGEACQWGICKSLSHKYGKGISASSCSNTLKSLTVRRTQCKQNCDTGHTDTPSKDSPSYDACENVETSILDAEEESSRLEMPHDTSTEAVVVKDKLASKANKGSSCESTVVEQSDTKECSGSGEIPGSARQQPALPSSTVTDACFNHLGSSSTQLDGLLTDREVKANHSSSIYVTVHSEVDVEPIKLPSLSQESGPIFDSKHLSESADSSPVDQAVFSIGHNPHEPLSQLSTSDLSEASCKTGRTPSHFGEAHTATDEQVPVSHFGGGERVHPAHMLNQRITPPQHDNRIAGGNSSRENYLTSSSEVSTSETPSVDQDQDSDVECGGQFITPKARKQNKSEVCPGRFVWRHGASPASNLSSDASEFDSVSHSTPLLGLDEISPSSESASSVSVDKGGKESQLCCPKIPEVEPVQHFIALKPGPSNNEQTDHASPTPSLHSTVPKRSASSFQTFKRSIEVMACSSRSGSHTVSMLHREQAKNDRQFVSESAGSQIQSAHFTTDSPILLKRRFGKALHKQDAAERTPRVHARRVTYPTCNSQGRCDPDKFESLGVADSEADSNPTANEQTYVASSASTLEEGEKRCTKHDSILLRPNLKRLKPMSCPVPQTVTTGRAELPKGRVNNTDRERGILDRPAQEPPIKKFMTSDSFMLQADASINKTMTSDCFMSQTDTTTMKPVADRKLCTDVELFLQPVPRHLGDPSLRKEGDKKLAEPTNRDTLDTSQIESKTALRVENTPLSTSEGTGEKSHAVTMEMPEAASSQAELVLERMYDPWQAQQSKDGCRSFGEAEDVFVPAQLFPARAQMCSESALKNIGDGFSCQEIPQNFQDTSSDSLPMPDGYLDSDILKLTEEGILNSSPSHARCGISEEEAAFSEWSEISLCPIDNVEWLMTQLNDNSPEYSQSDGDLTYPDVILCENALNPHDCEANYVSSIQGSIHVNNKQLVCANKDVEMCESDLVEAQQTSPQTPANGKTTNLNDPNQNGVPSDGGNPASRPMVFADTFGKMWSSHFDTKLKKEVYVDLATGNCSMDMPCAEILGSSEDGMSQEDARDVGNLPSALIIPTGRKRSHLHRTHSLCAQPFLGVSSAGMPGVAPRPASCQELSPSAHSALLHMVDDHIDQHGGEIASKWRQDECNRQTVGDSSMDQLFDNWTNPMFPSLEADILDANSSHMLRSCIRAQNTVNPCKFTKAMFQKIKVLGQVDHKFIACLASTDENDRAAEASLLLMIDQHAAHERVRLEQLVADVTDTPTTKDGGSDAAGPPRVKSSAVLPPVVLNLTAKELRLLRSFHGKLERLGVACRIAEDEGEAAGSRETGSSRVEVTRLPACLVQREMGELSRNRQPVAASLVQALLEEHLHELQRTAGASAVLPKTLTRILNSQACHGAIKFGDPLSHGQCLSLIGQLSQCQLPFQCAHGRPSVIPLFDLRLLASTAYDKVDEHKPRLWHLQRNMEKMRKDL